MIDWLKLHWFLLTTLVTVGIAWGQQQVKVLTIEEAVKEQVVIRQKVEDLKVQNAKVDERTKSILDNQTRQERLLELLIQQNQNITKKLAK